MKVLCPRHEDSNPSCEVYEDQGYCFVCSQSIPLGELGVKPEDAPKEKYIEDLEESRKFIQSLPKKMYRGLTFPCDGIGIYICWSGALYYKRRNFSEDPKYKNPSGHSQPLFWANKVPSRCLFIVEGEINALSLSLAIEDQAVCSPGSAGEFTAKKQCKNLTEYSKYNNIVLLADADGPGVAALIELKAYLLSNTKANILANLMSKDCNEILQEVGKVGLKEEIYKQVPAWVFG